MIGYLNKQYLWSPHIYIYIYIYIHIHIYIYTYVYIQVCLAREAHGHGFTSEQFLDHFRRADMEISMINCLC